MSNEGINLGISISGIPNPFIRALWENDDYYLKVLAARPKTLTPNQVYRIRELHADGRSGKAYSRIRVSGT